MHLQPIFEQYDYIGENVSEELFKKGICLPSDSKMTDEDLNRVVTAIKRVFNYGKK
jgi:dTDP-4-amino-4,6-dideoxygalactose transaminase